MEVSNVSVHTLFFGPAPAEGGNGFELKIRLLGKTFQEIIEQGFGKDYQNNATYLDREWAVISGVAAL
jgi:hypothetical protein